MILYRICTEATGDMRERAIAEVAKRFEGFTVIDTVGYWRGKREDSVVIEILAEKFWYDKIVDAAQAIREVNSQEAVCIQEVWEVGHSQAVK